MFPQKESSYSLRNSITMQSRSIKTVMYGSKTISSLGPKIGHFTDEVKNILSPTLLKKKIRRWASKNCPCRLCKTHVQNIGLL